MHAGIAEELQYLSLSQRVVLRWKLCSRQPNGRSAGHHQLLQLDRAMVPFGRLRAVPQQHLQQWVLGRYSEVP